MRRMAAENSGWGAPKIHGELLKLGFEVSERTVARYLQRLRRRGDPAKHWLAFLANHREVIVAFDFFTVPTLTFQLLYCFLVIEHGRRRIREATGLRPKRMSVQAPWQNGTAERWVGSCRREILDHVIALNEQHLRRLIRDYVNYYQDDRIHDSLDKDTPNRRPVESKPSPAATVISNARLGGLHHRYSWREAA
jgi:transposase InsO family protein